MTAVTSRGRAPYQLTFALLAMAVTVYALLQALVFPVLPTVQHGLHTSQTLVTWVLTAYLLSASVLTPIMGRAGDIFGKKPIFIGALVALTLGGLMAALAPDIWVMIVARVVQGAGGGAIPVAFGIIRDEFPPEKVTGAIGVISAITAVGSGAGLVLAGPLVDALDWHWLFWLPTILTAIVTVAAIVFVPDSTDRSEGRISWVPALLLSAFLVTLLIGVSEAPEWGWGSIRVAGLFVATVVLAPLWVWSELRADVPLIDLALMRRRAVWTNNAVALLVGVSIYAAYAFLPEFLQTPRRAGYGFGASVAQSGLILLPSAVMSLATGVWTGPLSRKVGARSLVVAGCLVCGTSMALMAFANNQRWELFLATALMGGGFGSAFAAMSALVVHAVPIEQTGVAAGMNANIRTIGGGIGSAVMASIVASHVGAGGVPKEAGYTAGFAMLAGSLLLAAVAGAMIPVGGAPRRRRVGGDGVPVSVSAVPG